MVRSLLPPRATRGRGPRRATDQICRSLLSPLSAATLYASARGEPADVADRVDVRGVGLVEGVDLQALPVVALGAGGVEAHRRGRALPADGVEQRLRPQEFPRLERGPHERAAPVVGRQFLDL